jgi:hypothetical protein
MGIHAERVNSQSASLARLAQNAAFETSGKSDPFLILIPDLRVFGLRQTWPAIPGLFVATQRRYAARASPSSASDVSQSF